MEVVCSPKCAIGYARESAPERIERMKARALARERREAKREKVTRLEELKPIRTLIKEAQREVNRYIRERDFFLGCVSCHMPASYAGPWHAGHYRTTAAAPHLRFNHDNIAKQCSQCNDHKSGNVVEYRKQLVERIGVERVEAVENDNSIKRWTREELIAIRREHTGLWRAEKAMREGRAA